MGFLMIIMYQEKNCIYLGKLGVGAALQLCVPYLIYSEYLDLPAGLMTITKYCCLQNVLFLYRLTVLSEKMPFTWNDCPAM